MIDYNDGFETAFSADDCGLPEITIGLLGVKVPREWGVTLNDAQWGFMRDMRLQEIERRILALEAASGTSGSAQDAQRLDPKGAGPAPEGGDAQ